MDTVLLTAVVIILLVGILNLYSASRMEEISAVSLYIKQIYWAALGLSLMFVTMFIDTRFFERWAYGIYLVSVFFLVAVLFFGDRTGGAARWFALGPISFQPSEFVKVSMILALGRYLQKNMPVDGITIRHLLIPAILAVVPTVLIIKEPDLGSAGLIVLVFGTLLIAVKMRPKTAAAVILTGVVSMFPAFIFGWRFLKPYQRQRILTFFRPDTDPLGSGYHIIQSKIAVGSGKIIGKGYMHGTQSQLQFLPEQHTDFIFSVLAEEWGFIGSIVLLVLFCIIVLRGFHIARSARDVFGAVVAVGISIIIMWQSFINIGMATGIFPVVGIPLPFLSYGGTSLVTMLIGVGLLLNIYRRRNIF
ncbi:MAG: rod shape-determining protein RodA [Deltaproteobacteria bacterium]|uniref:Peptidoglycan glycosyltransferase RodA n=1 Tax=Candidatus Zymogenus saltonus TaxID=2844893 RepID=A0A9D8KH90_9DELT|nr:rod shape-determining protein RodA [Candidatus Zymogenus saltonus]